MVARERPRSDHLTCCPTCHLVQPACHAADTVWWRLEGPKAPASPLNPPHPPDFENPRRSHFPDCCGAATKNRPVPPRWANGGMGGRCNLQQLRSGASWHRVHIPRCGEQMQLQQGPPCDGPGTLTGATVISQNQLAPSCSPESGKRAPAPLNPRHAHRIAIVREIKVLGCWGMPERDNTCWNPCC